MRYLLIVILLMRVLSADGEFERYCVSCHTKEHVSLKRAFMNALLVYGGEKNMKAGLKYFLYNPSEFTSVMGEEYFLEHRLKRPMEINSTIMDRALDEYWERYKVLGRLR